MVGRVGQGGHADHDSVSLGTPHPTDTSHAIERAGLLKRRLIIGGVIGFAAEIGELDGCLVANGGG